MTLAVMNWFNQQRYPRQRNSNARQQIALSQQVTVVGKVLAPELWIIHKVTEFISHPLRQTKITKTPGGKRERRRQGDKPIIIARSIKGNLLQAESKRQSDTRRSMIAMSNADSNEIWTGLQALIRKPMKAIYHCFMCISPHVWKLVLELDNYRWWLAKS